MLFLKFEDEFILLNIRVGLDMVNGFIFCNLCVCICEFVFLCFVNEYLLRVFISFEI